MKFKDQEKIDKKRQEIITIAKEIIIEDGIEGLSIRKIATRLHQTPGIIYHYYKDKKALIDVIVEQGYQHIVETIRMPLVGTVEEIFIRRLDTYIHAMLEDYQLFQIIMSSSSPTILEKVSFLTPGNSNRSSLKMLCDNLQKGCNEGVFVIDNIELRAQVMMSATYGLMQRIAIEKPDNRERIIEEHIKMLLQSIKG